MIPFNESPKLKISPEAEFRMNNPGIIRRYDIATDLFVNATQEDYDRVARAALNFTLVREQANKLHAEYVEDLRKA